MAFPDPAAGSLWLVRVLCDLVPEVVWDWLYSVLVRPSFIRKAPYGLWCQPCCLGCKEGLSSLSPSQLETTEVTGNRAARVYKECTDIHYARPRLMICVCAWSWRCIHKDPRSDVRHGDGAVPLSHRQMNAPSQISPRDWRNGSVARSTGHSPRGPGSESQHPHGSLQPPITPVSGDLMPSSGPCGHQAHSAQAYMQAKHLYT